MMVAVVLTGAGTLQSTSCARRRADIQIKGRSVRMTHCILQGSSYWLMELPVAQNNGYEKSDIPDKIKLSFC
jgi:hypothetical protein